MNNNNSVTHTLSNVNPEIDTITKIRDNFPAELQQVDQWVLWRYTMRGDKLTKVPFQTSGNEAKSNDPTTWASFADACHAYQNGNFDGLGFMFSEHDPYVGIDFDKCISESGMDSQRLEWIKSLDSYTEYSPSGKGVHIFIRGVLPGDGRKSNKLNVEMYEQARFFTVTGDHVEGTPATVNSRQKQLKTFHAGIFPPKEPSKPNNQPVVSYEGIPADDRELLDRMFNAANGHKIEALYNGDTGAYDGDKSAADIALCSHLAFWTGKDASRIDSLFRQSGLMRDKWDSKRPVGTYGTMTIDEAIKGATETYSGKRSAAKPVGFVDTETGETVMEIGRPTPKPDFMKFADLGDVDAAPQLPEYARLTEDEMQEAATTGGWLYDYVEFASKAAPMTPSIFHLSMGLGILSATVARRLHLRVGTQKIYPNLYILYCGPSTLERKTTGMNVGTAVMEAAGMLPAFTFAERQTPEAFVSDTTTAMPYTYDKWTRDAQQYWLSQRAIAGQRAWFLDEASHLLDSFNRDYTSGLLPLVLEIYDSKDRSGGRNTKNYGLEYIERSYLTVFGATTHASMSKHMQKIEHWHNGLFARFALVTSDQDVEWEFWSKPIEPPKPLVDDLRRMAFGVLGELPQVALFEGSTKSDDDDNGGKKRSGYEVVVGELQDTPCIISKDAWNAWERYSKAVGYDVLRSSSGNSIEQALFANYGRFSTMQIKVAMLLSLCDATATPVIIERKHILAAQMIVESWRESLHRARGKGRVTEQRTKADDVLNVLAKAGGEWVTKRELTRAMNCTWKDVEETIESLIEECAITAETYQPARGRSSLVYRLAK